MRSDRTMLERFRLYACRRGELRLLATTPTAGGIGVALVTLAGEGEIGQDETVGVLDTHGRDDLAGEWLVSPFSAGFAHV